MSTVYARNRTKSMSSFIKLVLSKITLVHLPSRIHIDPWSGQLFGEGGVEKTIRTKNGLKSHMGSSVKGKVIMSKLGNETAR